MKKLGLLLMSLLLSASLVGCGDNKSNGNSGNKEETFTLSIGHSDPTENLLHVALVEFEKYVEAETEGKVDVQIYAAEQLGSNGEMAEMVKLNNLDVHLTPAGVQSNYSPKVNVFSLPFLFETYEQVWTALDSQLGKDLVEEDLASNNMIQLAYWENGLRQTTTNVKPIVVPADLEGQKIRTPEDAITIAIYKALGSSPSPLAFSELYLALQNNQFDGQENPVQNIYANNFHDVQKYMSMTNHKYEHKAFIMSLDKWNSFPTDIQEVLQEAALKFGQVHRDSVVNSADSMIAELEAEGLEVNYPDLAPFQKATSSVYDDFYSENAWAKDAVAQIKELIK